MTRAARSPAAAIDRLLLGAGRALAGWRLIRPSRALDALGRWLYPRPAYRWTRNRWRAELCLSPHYHLDRNILLFGTYDPDLHSAIERLLAPGMIAIDAGANLGEVALHMASRVGAGGRVYAFEPAPHPHRRLVDHVARNRQGGIVRCLDLALSDRSGVAQFLVPDEAQDNQGLGGLGDRQPEGVGAPTAIEVRTTTLDAFLSSERPPRLDLIKLDLQGGEPLALAGAVESLRAHAPTLLLEVSPGDLGRIGRDSRDLCRQVQALGYRIHRLGRDGPGRAIDPERVAPDFAASNVVCFPASRA